MLYVDHSSHLFLLLLYGCWFILIMSVLLCMITLLSPIYDADNCFELFKVKNAHDLELPKLKQAFLASRTLRRNGTRVNNSTESYNRCTNNNRITNSDINDEW
jgi:hypothetical protein